MMTRFVPNLDFLTAVERGEIIVSIISQPHWSATAGLFKLRLHEEAGLIEPMLTAKWAGYPQALYKGLPAKLTKEGRRVLAQLQMTSHTMTP